MNNKVCLVILCLCFKSETPTMAKKRKRGKVKCQNAVTKKAAKQLSQVCHSTVKLLISVGAVAGAMSVPCNVLISR